MTEIIPAIDIIEGKCTRLSQGDYGRSKVYDGDPVDWARRFADSGVRRLHLVDLEGAKASAPVNLAVLEKIAALGSLKLEWGGGIKSRESLDSVWNAGATWAIVGSVAVQSPEMFEKWLSECGERLILGADVRDRRVAVNGWLESWDVELEALLRRFLASGLRQVIVTDISRDGMLTGPSFPLYVELKRLFPQLKLIAGGGVGSAADLLEAARLGLDGIIAGKAIYENRISLKELRLCLQNE
ncbi:MAG: 1-(5-phosphoribosyl)-5-[Bacteroidales bacterium]|nr:1-(5-phosphoribosyl)-5-[(5-phosphoribosylamino)methylideneamino]imidazole-4-carboxamide isomerase [Bacteroidales bacterium]